MYNDLSPHETDFAHRTCCVLIFFRETCADVCSRNLLHVDFSLRETCKLIFLIVKLILFTELVACWLVVELDETDCVDKTYSVLIFVFMKLLSCWFCSSWNLYIDFSPHETVFGHGTCCMLVLLHGTCCVLIFVRETCCRLIFSL